MHELSLASAIVDTVVRHAEGRRVTSVQMRIGALRQVVPDSLEFYFGIVARETRSARARAWSRRSSPARAALSRLRRASGSSTCPTSAARSCGDAEVEVVAGDEFEVESIEVPRR